MKKLLHFLFILSHIFLYAQHGINQNWSETVELPKSDINFNSSIDANKNMVILENELVFVIYSETNESGDKSLIYYITSGDGENWSSPEIFEPSTLMAGSSCPNITVDKNNTIHFVWHSVLPKAMYYCNYKEGVFSAPLIVSKSVKYNFEGKCITVDRSNRVHIFWHDGKPGTNQTSEIYYNRSTDNGNSFEGPILLSEDDGFHSAFPRADFSGTDGDILAVAWRDSLGYLNNTNWDILLAVSLDGGENWEIKQTISSEFSEWDPGISVDKNGKFILHYYQHSNDGLLNSSVWSTTSSDAGDNWSNPIKISTEEVNSKFTEFNYDYKNNVHWIFWENVSVFESGNTKVDIVGSYSLDAGSNWSNPEYITDFGDLNIASKSTGIGNNGKIGLIYERYDSLSMLSSIYYLNRTPIQFPQSYQTKKNKDETNWASAYPNPASSEVTITFRCNSPGEYEVGIFNLLGEKKVAHNKYFETGIGQLNFKISDFLPGIYFYTVVGNGKVVTGKLTKVVF